MMGVMWLIIGILIFYQYQREVAYRSEEVRKQLDIIDSRIINAYEKGIDLRPFMNFLSEYFTDTMFDDISVSVYDSDQKLMYNVGTPILQDFSENNSLTSPNTKKAVKAVVTLLETVIPVSIMRSSQVPMVK